MPALTVKTYDQLTDSQKQEFFDYLSTLPDKDSGPAVANMWDEEWSKKINTLPYALTNTSRFSTRGCYYILYGPDRRVWACSGVHVSEFNANIGLAGSRTYVDKTHRNQLLIYKVLLPLQKAWCVQQNLSIVALSFNEYNRNLIKVFSSSRMGVSKQAFNIKTPNDIFYSGMHVVPFPVTIKKTRQWVIYEKLGSWDYDWSEIKASEDSQSCK